MVRAHQDVVSAQDALRAAVAAARGSGRSWAEIGDSLGVSRQAAFKRFGTPTDPRTGSPLPRRAAGEALALATRVMRQVAEGSHDLLRSWMTSEAAEVLTEDRLADTWARVVAETGDLVEIREVATRTPGGEPVPADERVTGVLVGVVALCCEAGEWEGRVASDGDGRVVGLLVCAPGSEGLAF